MPMSSSMYVSLGSPSCIIFHLITYRFQAIYKTWEHLSINISYSTILLETIWCNLDYLWTLCVYKYPSDPFQGFIIVIFKFEPISYTVVSHFVSRIVRFIYFSEYKNKFLIILICKLYMYYYELYINSICTTTLYVTTMYLFVNKLSIHYLIK